MAGRCCDKGCFPIPETQIQGQFKCCGNRGWCKCKCKTYISKLRRCCDRGCFPIPTNQIDGPMRKCCGYYGWCRCKCETYIKDNLRVMCVRTKNSGKVDALYVLICRSMDAMTVSCTIVAQLRSKSVMTQKELDKLMEKSSFVSVNLFEEAPPPVPWSKLEPAPFCAIGYVATVDAMLAYLEKEGIVAPEEPEPEGAVAAEEKIVPSL